MPRPPHPRSAGVEGRGPGMGSCPQRQARQGRLALQHRKRASETQKVVPRTMNDLGDYDAGDIDAFFAAAVHARLTILLAGATGAGKTFLSKSLITEIDPSERIITIEDTLELIIPQPNHVRLLYSKDGLSGARVTVEDLLQASLRQRPDR